MKGIGGNINATIQVKDTTKNAIGEHVQEWSAVQTLRGWLDLSAGKSGYSSFNTKIQESTHIFVGDYVPLDSRITVENSRMVINGNVYDIMLLDNPMELGSGSQWEIYLKYTGGR